MFLCAYIRRRLYVMGKGVNGRRLMQLTALQQGGSGLRMS